jgi:hypothetical protein
MIDRLFRNPKTTIIGLAVLVVSFAFVWFGKSTLTEVGIFIMGGFRIVIFQRPRQNRWRQKLRRRPQRRTFQNPVSVANTPNP